MPCAAPVKSETCEQFEHDDNAQGNGHGSDAGYSNDANAADMCSPASFGDDSADCLLYTSDAADDM
eukprot:141586-Alexandrium_andersonii.AAC.1